LPLRKGKALPCTAQMKRVGKTKGVGGGKEGSVGIGGKCARLGEELTLTPRSTLIKAQLPLGAAETIVSMFRNPGIVAKRSGTLGDNVDPIPRHIEVMRRKRSRRKLARWGKSRRPRQI